ncbi:Cytochrome b5-like Heme/Steroid binding domain protein [Mycobacterium basiliense]|uniref:Cytochrome b5-like Heme/Steroid binding domain protein n=1 Tax=Mycobacterium basiliense TaxID=2094119 RepID=A0A447GDD6_9MYCO|nr:fatty acid desaturase [Mycobacterium basiliense]VDM88455.1 Cytochrome b5-like Heme/Steroid binding domain protein [Mycobacterium basiliense]
MTNDLPEVRERGPGPRPAPPPGGPPMSDVWVYKGRAYDLSDWISKHPGGAFFIGRTKNRDITAVIAAYHRDPAKVERILQRRYALGRDATPKDIHPKHNAPAFLFKEDFNSWRDIPQYRFDDKNDLMHRVKARLSEPALAARIKRMDTLFNVIVATLAVAYLAVQGLRLSDPRWMPLPAFVIAMVVLRSSLAGFGHYALHRAQRGINRVLGNSFDMNYVALSLVTADGHTLLHHPYTQSDVDIKKNVFTMMMQLPRLYRVPLHTIHKFGHMFSGMAIRIADVCRVTRKAGVEQAYGSWRVALPHFLGSSGVRLLLVTELLVFVLAGDFWAWALQFVATLWVSTFLVVASHEFEDDREDEVVEGNDWGVDQVVHANDLKVIGNRYVDCFLSAGLSSHRVHHVLPFQRSGFANIVTEDVLREESAKFGVEWLPARSFVTDRLPKLCRTYLLAPSRLAREKNWDLLREHCSPAAWKASVGYVVAGFVGIGSV